MITFVEFQKIAAEVKAHLSGEPVFMLRANDENAPAVICTWARDYLESKGGYGKASKAQIEKYEDAIQQASDFRVWRMQQQKAG